jgi:hypothetical protein
MKKLSQLILLFSITASIHAQDCSDLFFSEYVEGSGNNKALEIYNPTNQTIFLNQYWVTRFSNGSPIYDKGGKTKLQGFILPYSTFILVNGQTIDTQLEGGGTSPKCDPALQKLATETFNGMMDGIYPAPTYMNGNDAIALFKDPVGNGNYNDFIGLDLFGAIADGTKDSDEGWAPFTQQWVYKNIKEDTVIVGRDSAFIRKYIVPEGYWWIPWTSGHTLIRKSFIKHGVQGEDALVDSFNVTLEWDTVPQPEGKDVWDYLGSHTCGCDPASSAKTITENSELFIYPNPAEGGRITLYTTEFIDRAEIFDITGKLVYRQNLGRQTGMINLSLNDSPPGIFLLKILTANNNILNRKFIMR